MGDGNDAFIPDSAFVNFSAVTAMDLDFMDELLYDGCWLEAADAFNILQAGASTTSGDLNEPKGCVPFSELSSGNLNVSSRQVVNSQENPPVDNPKMEELGEVGSRNQNIFKPVIVSAVQSRSFPVESNELGRRLWIAPSADMGPSSSVRDRLIYAIGKLKECTKDRDVLIQIWVPIKQGGKQVLTTIGQPYLLNPTCQSLASYRNISKTFHFPADTDSNELVGLPGRVFLRQMPEWTPDVRVFRRDEYPRKNHAKRFNISGSFAVPVFEQSSRTCLGVIEVVTTQNFSYCPDIKNLCKALETVDLRSPADFIPPSSKVCKELCQAAVPEISEILESVCKACRLPLAITWAPCFQAGNGGCRRFDENHAHCISTVDSAFFVAERDLLGFYMACSEQGLFLGQGIVGRAFATNRQCFSTNVTAFSKTVYPLSHQAKMFELHAAVAIPLKTSYAGSADFVLELYLPKDCRDIEEQKQTWDLLAIAIQKACRSFHVVMDKELEETVNMEMPVVASDEGFNKEITWKFISSSKESSQAEPSWIANMMDARQKGKEVCISWDHPKEEPKEEFNVTASHWDKTQEELYQKQVFSEFGKFQQHSEPKGSIETGMDSSSAGHHSVGSRKSGERRRTKTEKTISLQVLRQYFAGSLKDAAKSIGVCPTTLKRICRQHGITRWPSRKIKKVGHSLKKLQLVIDSVQGAEGAIQIGSFYTTFPELTSPNFSGSGAFPSVNTNDDSQKPNPGPESGMFGAGASASKSPSSSCSQSSGSSICCSTGVKQHTATNNCSISGDPLMAEDPGGMLKRTHSDAELHALSRDELKLLVRSQSHKLFGELASPETLPPLPSSGRTIRHRGGFRVKATFGEDKIRFSLQPNWGFGDLQKEIADRFNIEDITQIDLKYLDDDLEWVLLTCDADLDECQEVCKSTDSHTIKISLHQPSQPHLGSSAGSGRQHLGSSLGTGGPF